MTYHDQDTPANYTGTPSEKDTYNSVSAQLSSISDALEKSNAFDTIPPQFPDANSPINQGGRYFTNPETGGLYKWVEKTSESSATNTSPDFKKPVLNKYSWIFVPHDADLTIGLFDPRNGNVWVDDNDAYILYYYHAGEAEVKDGIRLPNGWYAITEKKRGYDNFIIQLADKPENLAVISGGYDNVANPDDIPDGVFLQQGFIYYNTDKEALFIFKGEVDEYGNAIDTDDQWVQLSRGSSDPTPEETGFESQYTDLQSRLAVLEQQINAL